MPAVFTKPTPSPVFTNALPPGFPPSAAPQPAYAMDLERIIALNPPADDLFVGWRYLYLRGPNDGVAADVDQISGGSPFYAGVAYGPKIAQAWTAAQNIGSVPGIPDGTYEVRFLTIPGILTDSLWLKVTSGGSDWVVPYDTIAPSVSETDAYPMSDFLRAVLMFATERYALHLK